MKRKDFLKDKPWKKWDKSQWTILILFGVLLLVLAIPTGDKKDTKKKEVTGQEETEGNTAAENDYEKALEEKLRAALSKVEGAGQVEVMITLKDQGEYVVGKDKKTGNTKTTEGDSQGGTRTQEEQQEEQTTVYSDDGSGQKPFIQKQITPQVEGVLVVAQGGGNAVVIQNISEAVMALFPVEAHRIKVVKMNMQEDGF